MRVFVDVFQNEKKRVPRQQSKELAAFPWKDEPQAHPYTLRAILFTLMMSLAVLAGISHFYC